MNDVRTDRSGVNRFLAKNLRDRTDEETSRLDLDETSWLDVDYLVLSKHIDERATDTA